jgi:hypothetical protein
MPQHRVAVSRSGEFARLFVKNKATARDDRVFLTKQIFQVYSIHPKSGPFLVVLPPGGYLRTFFGCSIA